MVAIIGKPSYAITPSKEGTTTTIVILATVSAVGTYTYPPIMIIFKGIGMKPDMCVGSPVWSLVRLSENGWITSEVFLKWCQMFVKSLPKDDEGLPYVSTGRKRVKCQLFGCRKWYHNECQGIPEKTPNQRCDDDCD